MRCLSSGYGYFRYFLTWAAFMVVQWEQLELRLMVSPFMPFPFIVVVLQNGNDRVGVGSARESVLERGIR